MSGWDTSMHDGGGWGADASFATTAPADSATQRTGDKVPIPVTVSTLAQSPCSDDKFTIGHIHFSMVMFIGRVESVQEQDAGQMVEVVVADPDEEHFKMKLNILRPTLSDDSPAEARIVEGELFMVVGKLRSSNGETHVLVLKVRDSNAREYECFKLDARIAKIYHEKGVADALRGGNFLAELRGCPAGPPTNMQAGDRRPTSAPAAQAHAPNRIYASAQPVTSTMTGGPRKRVLDYLKQEAPVAGENGVHVDDIVRGTGLPRNDVEEQLRYLTGEGEAFETTDSEHFAVF